MRTSLIFIAGVAAAVALTHATVAFACCFQPSDWTTLHLVSSTIDGEPTVYPEGFPPVGYEATALWDGVQIDIIDPEGFVIGSETFTRRMP